MKTKINYEEFRQWVLLSLLLLLPSGVFVWGCIDPNARPLAIQFAEVAFGSAINRLVSDGHARKKQLQKRDESPPD